MSGATEAPPRAQLLCRSGELAGQTHELTRSNVIGRNSDNDVVLHSSLISGKHARIWEKDGSFFVEDLGSSNGTWVDGIRITDPVRLDRLNVITFAGAFDFVFAVPERAGRAPSETETAPRAPSEAESGGTAAPTVRLEAEGDTPAEDAQRTRLDMDFQPLPHLEGDEGAQPAARASDEPPGASAAAPPDDDVGRTRLDMDFQPMPDLEGERQTEPPAQEAEPHAQGIDPTTTESEDAPSGPGAPPPPTDDAGRTRLDMDFQPLPDLEEQKEEAQALPGYRLETALPDGRQKVFEVERGRYTLGRSPDCDITLDEPSISRHHATLTVGDALVLEDADSVNGTLVDGSEIDRAELTPNSTFSLGPFVEVKVTKR